MRSPRSTINDITSGSNGVFSAGPGYDEVTGLGSPKATSDPDLATYGTASRLRSRPSLRASVIAGDSFGVVVAAENPAGYVDPAFDGSVTISLGIQPRRLHPRGNTHASRPITAWRSLMG